MVETPNFDFLDVAIIGAGAAGLYSAFRLLTGQNKDGQHAPPNLAIFEASSRIGGRLHSIRLNPDRLTCELGGMRYLSSHKIITSLVEKVFAEKYGLKAIDFEYGEANNCIYFMRSARCTGAELVKCPEALKFKLDDRWTGKSPDEIAWEIFEGVFQADGYNLSQIMNNTHQSNIAWEELNTRAKYRFPGPYQDMYLHEMTLKQLFLDRSDTETWDFWRSTSGYDCLDLEWSAVEACRVMLEGFTASTNYKTIEDGFDKILHCLAAEIREAGARILLHSRLHSISKSSDKHYPYKLDIVNSRKSQSYQVFAKSVVLCIPTKSLQRLQENIELPSVDLMERSAFQSSLNSVLSVPVTKILLTFAKPWWRDSLGLIGRTLTDLPLRQSIYFGSKDPNKPASVVLASYADTGAARYWSSLHKNALTDNLRLPTTDVHCPNKLELEDSNGCDTLHEVVLKEVMSQLRQVHGEQINISDPCDSAFADWTEGAHEAGYHLWRAGVNAEEIRRKMSKPFKMEDIFIAGEAYSDEQSWVEGAFKSVEFLMQKNFYLIAPEWLCQQGQIRPRM